MRTVLLAAACLLGLVGASRGEFDAAGAAPVKAAFTGIAASKRPAIIVNCISPDGWLIFAGAGNEIGGGMVMVNYIAQDFATAKVRRTHRPANIPSSRYVETVLGIWIDLMNSK